MRMCLVVDFWPCLPTSFGEAQHGLDFDQSFDSATLDALAHLELQCTAVCWGDGEV